MADDGRAHVLVVEDSPMMVRMYRMVLGPDYALAFAADGVAGLDEAARAPRLDALVVDVNMPGMDGLEFVRRLRAELGVGAPVLVCTTESSPEDRAAAAAAGATAFLPKPWTPPELQAAVRALLGGG